MNHIVRILGVSSALLLCAQGALAQCENKSGFAKLACQAQTNSNGPFQAAKPDAKTFLSTSFADTIHGDTLPASIDPKAYKPLTDLERADDGAFILKAGIYEAYVQSYTLDPGDANTTKAGGYYPAPIKGAKAKIVASLLKQIELHPDVSQNDVQQLLLAIVQGVDLEKMPPNVQQTAARVLPKEIIAQMRGDVDCAKLATLIVSTLEGSLMVSRLQRKEEPLDSACRHLGEYLKSMRSQKSRGSTA